MCPQARLGEMSGPQKKAPPRPRARQSAFGLYFTISEPTTRSFNRATDH